MSIKKLLLTTTVLCAVLCANAQIGVMKMVGKNTQNYGLGFGAYIEAAIPISEADDITSEIGANFFFLHDGGTGDGTAICPLKIGYRFSINRTGYGFYFEPQAGYNLYGVTSMLDDNGYVMNLKFHGVVLTAGAGYKFDLGHLPFDVHFRYETVIAHGGSDNIISLGFTRSISFRRRED